MDISLGPLDCACVIHGDAYDWQYVDRLYNMLGRHITRPIKLHVYTEASRPVPEPYIKHSLTDWQIAGPKQAWWYKMQLFDPQSHCGPLLYFDLDVVIVSNIDWIWQQNPTCFWSIKDFKYLWRPAHTGTNTSIMWWDTRVFSYVWNEFNQANFKEILRHYRGDQDYVNEIVSPKQRRYFGTDKVLSWRWQCLNGGYNFKQRIYFQPDSGTQIPRSASVLIFHGHPKPADIQDPVIVQHWR